MPDIYQELLTRALATYRLAGNGFHPEANAKQIDAAADGFYEPFGALATVIARQKAGGYPTPDAYAAAWRDALRILDAQRGTLEAAIGSAAAADSLKARSGATLDVQALLQRAKGQQAADATLLASIDDIIRQGRADAAAAGGGGPPPLSSMTVSQWIANEIAEISGAESEDDEP